MNILISGNMGYVGSVLVSEIRKCGDARIIGIDSAYFADCVTQKDINPEIDVDSQLYRDIRDVGIRDFEDIDIVVCLSALSNDPMGIRYALQTLEINYGAVAKIAILAKTAGVKKFIFASSCSVYGFSESGECDEVSSVNPLTEYAKSKVLSERFLDGVAEDSFNVTCFRFATACGVSPRLRLDLVLNDFVASAVTTGKIEILSDGTPWRPLIDVKDMAASIIWAFNRKAGGSYLLLNAGCNGWNFQIKELAEIVQSEIHGTEICINPNGQPDKRSYKVRFDKYGDMTGGLLPRKPLKDTVREIYEMLSRNGFSDPDFRKSRYIRLNVLEQLEKDGCIGTDLRWVKKLS
jgi:nucleoside-diphosphate-sugar epimerase